MARRRGSTSLNPSFDYAGGLRGPAPARGGGSGGSGSGGKGSHGGGFRGSGGGAGGGPSWSAALSSANESAANKIQNAALRATYKGVRGKLQTGEKALEKSYTEGLQGVDTALTGATGAVTEGRDTSLGYYQPYADATAGAPEAYRNAIGLGGAQGSADARTAFRAAPGYQYALEQGLGSINRTAAARGEIGGGSNEADLYKFAQGMSDEDWNAYLDRLQGEQQFGAGIAGQQAGITGGAATDIANLQTGAAGTRLNALTQLGGQKYGYAKDLGDLLAAKNLGIAGNQAGYQLSKDKTSGNLIGLASGALNTALTAFGVGGFGGGGGAMTGGGSQQRPLFSNPFQAPTTAAPSGSNVFNQG